jgi:hypothetical protein
MRCLYVAERPIDLKNLEEPNTIFVLQLPEGFSTAAGSRGGGSMVNIQRQQTNFEAFAMIGPQTGGAASLWVNDPNGNLIVNETLTPNTEPPSPLGYYGFYELSFPMSLNGTYQFGITNSWAVSSVFSTCDNIAHIPPPPNEEYFLMTFFGFLVVGLYFLGKIAKRART